MKKRMGYGFVEADGTGTWMGDCPQWAQRMRNDLRDRREIRVIILGAGKWRCGYCKAGRH